ncbi:MAG: glycosyltransferase family 9 protein [Brumimicrobium sp.]|nr:glycosyltransferase family 9 protein [Brumimicrobium sp.]
MNQTLDLHNKTIVISRTDSIGDVILTLPLCGWIKEACPSCKIIFLGRDYTLPVLECYPAIDRIESWNNYENKSKEEQVAFFRSLQADIFIHVFPQKQIAKAVRKARIPKRVGTSHRLFHLLTCNIRPDFTRKKSELHEAQLNFELLKPLGLHELPTLDELRLQAAKFKPAGTLPSSFSNLLQTHGKRVILHPKSQGSAVEWPLDKYISLARKLIENDVHVYFSGTEKEGLMFRKALPEDKSITDISGRMTLKEFILFINQCDALVACSTGPLHIAAYLGKKAVGLYTNVRPMHPGRWAPLGENSSVITLENEKVSSLSPAEEIQRIETSVVLDSLKEIL